MGLEEGHVPEIRGKCFFFKPFFCGPRTKFGNNVAHEMQCPNLNEYIYICICDGVDFNLCFFFPGCITGIFRTAVRFHWDRALASKHHRK